MAKKKKYSTAKAVALLYNPDSDKAPRVAAKGSGALADKILKIAKEKDIPIREDPDLIELLSSIDFMEEIPSTLFTAVAEILSFIYKVNELKILELQQQEQGIFYAQRNLYGSLGDDAPPDQTGGSGE